MKYNVNKKQCKIINAHIKLIIYMKTVNIKFKSI